MKLAIQTSRLITPLQKLRNAIILINGDKIEFVRLQKNVAIPEEYDVWDVGDRIVAPGLVDIHIHGANGYFAREGSEAIHEISRWLATTGTTPWLHYGEGPTKMEKAGYFMEDAEVAYTPKDIRFTAKGDTLYATCLGWPDGQVKIESYKQLYDEEIESVTMLGFDGELKWSLDRSGLTIAPPPEKPGKHAFVFKVERRHPYGG